VRKAAAIVAAAGLLIVGLSGCTSSASAADCSQAASAGTASNAISVSGKFGSTNPRVSFPSPLHTKTTERTILKKGTGPDLAKGQVVVADIALYNGTTGTKIPNASWAGQSGPLTFAIGNSVPGIDAGLVCAKLHSRVAIAISPKQGAQDGSTSMVAVVDVRKAFLTRADGAKQAHVPNTPKVVLAPNGAPGITIPAEKAAPTKQKTLLLQKGTGELVHRKDQLVVQYTGVDWKTGDVTTSTWNDKGATGMVADDSSASGAQGGSLPGLASAVIGQHVGSQVLTIVPQSKSSGSAGDATVYVIDILGILH